MSRLVFGLTIVLTLPQLTAAAEKEPLILKGHTGWVGAVAFSPDSKTLASASADKTVRLWDVATGKEKAVLKGHTDYVCAVAFTSNGDYLATGSFDNTAKLWNAVSGKEERTLKGHRGAVLSVAFHRIGIPVTGGVDGKIIWHAGERDVVSDAHKSWVNSVALSHEDRPWSASGSSDGTVYLSKYQKETYLEGGAGEVRCVAISPDNKLIAAGNRYGTVRVWDVATEKEVVTLKGLMGEVWSIAFSPDGKTLAAVDTEWKKPSSVKLFDTTTWKERTSLPVPAEILCLAYSPDGKWLAVGSWDKTVRLFPVGR